MRIVDFNIQKPLYSATHMVILETLVGTRGQQEKKVKVQLLTKRNDRWLNTHMPCVIEVMKSNHIH